MSVVLSNALQDSTESADWDEEAWRDWMEEESGFVDKFAFGDALPAQLAEEKVILLRCGMSDTNATRIFISCGDPAYQIDPSLVLDHDHFIFAFVQEPDSANQHSIPHVQITIVWHPRQSLHRSVSLFEDSNISRAYFSDSMPHHSIAEVQIKFSVLAQETWLRALDARELSIHYMSNGIRSLQGPVGRLWQTSLDDSLAQQQYLSAVNPEILLQTPFIDTVSTPGPRTPMTIVHVRNEEGKEQRIKAVPVSQMKSDDECEVRLCSTS
ncbi:hypothetical protein HBI56_225390 [Parastagonospora nodorum]|uniref:Uncharacterized protein n=2 Tax=Phaeosphaeria nodorum (strain SN15 / ATCC MYA-4574 / FGSC 10173) TaxID=321614 RepID=A0A7U2ID74_PHANO|nr:hypothetical protein SNOG_16304 [Parastagonospora nodorum SN15]KAH3904089.1 hypothetical protein HBH56_239010 [Parastagonospora nodorum]EAT76290.1 hypothetical protein SNOG_16304 [Parastagonospora nodorum SN15]KAH3921646.1 hypothetical protein HBH54_237030 [Parastagonospora nodorum]KAH3957889.1 hypothetical protein HBH51_217500 [Parastagonospora nodorum]KAH3967445.1 hypothetical protein HBH52_186730 [Parastagonospora nodorum]